LSCTAGVLLSSAGHHETLLDLLAALHRNAQPGDFFLGEFKHALIRGESVEGYGFIRTAVWSTLCPYPLSNPSRNPLADDALARWDIIQDGPHKLTRSFQTIQQRHQ
jgi:hypothetical protein